MKKVFFGMLLIALGFGTMSLTTSSDYVAKTSMHNQKEVEVAKVVVGPTFTIPWKSCCESPLTPIYTDLAKRGYPSSTNFTINSTTSTTVTYTIW
ncbi:hypothetical protein [Flavobacterium pectinovorum]|jgi:hypothetical protein|uniref:Uncharacterized protein n=1 Tax=Flavobacterium pectinovorum TaxID=29533 RepID=A0A502EF05_9FLAO|nr:hypothetical protein [Flavobacterium pectinovorum]TPG36283.1 hypothetical protein EAH81_19615 [Flavobacterium pectinovorum]